MKDMMERIKNLPMIDVQFHRKAGYGLEAITAPMLFCASHKTYKLPAKTVQRWQKAYWVYRDTVREMQSLEAEVEKEDAKQLD